MAGGRRGRGGHLSPDVVLPWQIFKQLGFNSQDLALSRCAVGDFRMTGRESDEEAAHGGDMCVKKRVPATRLPRFRSCLFH